MSGRDVGHLPFRVASAAGRHVLAPLVLRVLFHRVMTMRTPVGRTVRPRIIGRGGPLIRVRPRDLAAAGVERVPRTSGVRGGLPALEDGHTLDVSNVVWCTGFDPGFSWIDLPGMATGHEPPHERGVAAGEPGLYFVGLHFLYAMSSAMIHGVGRDAEHIAGVIAGRHARERESARDEGGARLPPGAAVDSHAATTRGGTRLAGPEAATVTTITRPNAHGSRAATG
jgi:putative flavoprotein involved in K+ transport